MPLFARSIALVFAAAVLTACARTPSVPAPAPASNGSVTPSELEVYRTVAESVYVRATEYTVAISSTVMDSTCSGWGCERISAQPGTGGGPASIAGSTPLPPARELIMRDAREIRLDRVALGHPRLVVVDAADIPLVSADTSTWRYFRGNYGGIAGVLRFSPIGFDPAGEHARVSVLWRCGPACGHLLKVTLRAAGSGKWEIGDMLLLRPDTMAPNALEQ